MVESAPALRPWTSFEIGRALGASPRRWEASARGVDSDCGDPLVRHDGESLGVAVVHGHVDGVEGFLGVELHLQHVLLADCVVAHVDENRQKDESQGQTGIDDRTFLALDEFPSAFQVFLRLFNDFSCFHRPSLYLQTKPFVNDNLE